MESLDLNIDNYNLPDILSLFNLPTLFNEADLKRAKLAVLKTHPDKCQLPKEYFLFFTKAYRIVRQEVGRGELFVEVSRLEDPLVSRIRLESKGSK
jgi:hypothetical protein